MRSLSSISDINIPELQVRRGNKDNSEIIFLISTQKHTIVVPNLNCFSRPALMRAIEGPQYIFP